MAQIIDSIIVLALVGAGCLLFLAYIASQTIDPSLNIFAQIVRAVSGGN